MTASHQESMSRHHDGDITKAIGEKQLTLNMSQLMGCDYIFIDANQTPELFSPEQILTSIQGLIDLLDTNPRQTVIILVDDKSSPRFTRHDFIWDQDRIKQVNTLAVTTPEQIEFMSMMLDCSTLY